MPKQLVFCKVQPGIRSIKRRSPNMFILYRKEMMKYRPKNIKMTEFSKIVSRKWHNLSEYEKNIWQRRYHINRDTQLQNASDSPIEPLDDNPTYTVNPNSVNVLPSVMRGDCYLTLSQCEDSIC
ncbi:20141_t:CDS:1 [Funneliformis geosporum]|uniref:15802_t:CDS:1 n=1 Tax=Funneliformis geosporum TaxID=1117311 RepID=A0A9W4SWP8_9GLOM|nr:20141_t:CDS:1 [Funneliformis geosporum]CAI2181816.1 15802_t:CDS:1 [Funneliformis geosporum]